jgi:hypothetical protein
MSWKKVALVMITAPLAFVVAGCEQRYRYPCQDMNNWDKPECQKPRCEIHKECPENIFEESVVQKIKPATTPMVPTSTNKQGECK